MQLRRDEPGEKGKGRKKPSVKGERATLKEKMKMGLLVSQGGLGIQNL